MIRRKKARASHERSDHFDGLPDDIVISILCKLSSTARCPSDFISVLSTCKRLNRLALHPLVLSRAGPRTLGIRAKNWSDQAHRFLKLCITAGNLDACYALGMIRFYCLQKRVSGASLMAKAAIKTHAPALYSLSVIQFNASGASKTDRDLRAAVALCARAAYLGHIDALRELGHCLQDGYGVRQNIAEGRRLLIQANARELALVLRAVAPSKYPRLTWQLQNQQQGNLLSPANLGQIPGPGLGPRGLPLSDVWCNVPARETHPVNRFLAEWFELKEGGPGQWLRMCSHAGCGRPETRISEFRRCSACGTANYCSRGCQAQDWKLRHKVECSRPAYLLPLDADGGGGDDRMAEIEEEAGGGASG